ncbi:uncharacterized protein LOC120659861 isoform X2 [Panicum virgatum]|uniref:uncharacterized protein LOC120659861 isoform X2 n=1 Tax=Panicum virgatum TaxID=38727 RepID=UPI0019D5B849|nr:uncharacterized protein LOC120659861 isoform X2 [Panicum virgatum]
METAGLRSIDESPSPTSLPPMRPSAMLSWAAVALTLAASALLAATPAAVPGRWCHGRRRSQPPLKFLRESRYAGPLQSGSNGMRRRYKPRSGGTLTSSFGSCSGTCRRC